MFIVIYIYTWATDGTSGFWVGLRGGFGLKLLAQDCAGRVTAVLEGLVPRGHSTPTNKILHRSLIIFMFGKHIEM